jgi:hypothetical protein
VKLPSPELVAEHHNRRSGGDFVGAKWPTQQGRNAQHAEHIAVAAGDDHMNSVDIAAGKNPRGRAERGRRAERDGARERRVFRRCHGGRPGRWRRARREHAHKLVRRCIRKRAQQHPVDNGEHSGVESDPKPERQNGSNRDDGPAAKHSHRIRHVAADPADEVERSGVTM